MHLATILERQAARVLHSVPIEVMYRDIIGVLEGHYRDHQLGVTTFPAKEQDPANLQESATATEQLDVFICRF
jgi:hypothetical protein